MPNECDIGVPRVTRIGVDPAEPRHIWAVIEAGGPWRSFDGGDTWQKVWGGLNDSHAHQDMHNITLVPNTQLTPSAKDGYVTLGVGRKTTVLFTAISGVFATDDGGETVRPIVTKDTAPMPYFQGTAVRPDNPNVMFIGIGDTVPGTVGAVARSKDGGHTWEKMDLPVLPNTELHQVVINPENPDQVVAASLFGQLYKSDDGGNHWEKLQRELSEIRDVAVIPN